MKQCPNCRSEIAEGAGNCLNCGATLHSDQNTTSAETIHSPAERSPLALGIVASAPERSTLRTSSRAITISGLLLCLLFFSPFVSCSSQTFTGAEAFQASLPTEYDAPKDGIFLILFPIVGIAGLIIGLMAMKRASQPNRPNTLRGCGILVLMSSLVGSCPIAIALNDVGQSRGTWQLEWGFWGSTLAVLIMFVGAIGLIRGDTIRVVPMVAEQ